eukprot:TRINITY_DN7050_c0_g1_i1.p1 TRINITY_DN7050_c0_g1~~TRINITY_DN7050_c0_g1_i1.p1  ORF type:complete len:164 (-),score=13.79 TRINITY_DN7050_c0_g1_i1:70-519(-)
MSLLPAQPLLSTESTPRSRVASELPPQATAFLSLAGSPDTKPEKSIELTENKGADDVLSASPIEPLSLPPSHTKLPERKKSDESTERKSARVLQSEVLKVFNQAQRTIFANMHDAAFPRYRQSPNFLTLCQQLKRDRTRTSRGSEIDRA